MNNPETAPEAIPAHDEAAQEGAADQGMEGTRTLEVDDFETTDPGDRGGDVASESEPDRPAAAAPKPKTKPKAAAKLKPNNVKKLRIERMMSKAELARRANLSVLTIDRVEKGFGSRMNTKRKILEALGLSLADRVKVFGEEE